MKPIPISLEPVTNEETAQESMQNEEQKSVAEQKSVTKNKRVKVKRTAKRVKVKRTAKRVKVKHTATGKKKRRNLVWLFVLVIIITAAVLLYLFRAPIQKGIHCLFEKKAKIEPIETPSKAQPSETSVAEEEIAPEGEIAGQNPPENEAIAEEGTASYVPEVIKTTADGKYPYIRFEKGHFYVIAGSLTTEKGVEDIVQQNRLDSYHPTFVLQEGVAHIRVCIAIFDKEEEALAFAKNLSSKYWVLK